MARFLLFLLIVTTCVGCSHEDDGPDRTTPALAAPHPFSAASPGVPAGYREVRCPDLRRHGTGLTVRLVVPDQVTGFRHEDNTCTFTLSPEARGVLAVQLGPDESLARWRRAHLDPYVSDQGDDAVGEIAYRDDADGLDGATAEELRWYSYDDGSPQRVISLLGTGVRLTWSVADGAAPPTADLDRVRRSVAVVEGTRSTCPGGGGIDGRTLTFTPPVDLGRVERDDRRCRIHVDGSLTTLEGGEIDPAPSAIDALAARLRRDPEVTGVRLVRGATTIGGEPADRLSWVVVRTEETENYEPAGTWRIVVVQSAHARVRWGATPAWWRTHRARFEELVDSVVISPGPPSRS